MFSFSIVLLLLGLCLLVVLISKHELSNKYNIDSIIRDKIELKYQNCKTLEELEDLHINMDSTINELKKTNKSISFSISLNKFVNELYKLKKNNLILE